MERVLDNVQNNKHYNMLSLPTPKHILPNVNEHTVELFKRCLWVSITRVSMSSKTFTVGICKHPLAKKK